MAIKDWHYEKDAYGDDSWDREKEGFYYELRIYPNAHNWSLLLLKFSKNDFMAKSISKRTLKKAENREELSKYAKAYMRSH